MIALFDGSTAIDITRPDATAGPIARAFSPENASAGIDWATRRGADRSSRRHADPTNAVRGIPSIVIAGSGGAAPGGVELRQSAVRRPDAPSLGGHLRCRKDGGRLRHRAREQVVVQRDRCDGRPRGEWSIDRGPEERERDVESIGRGQPTDQALLAGGDILRAGYDACARDADEFEGQAGLGRAVDLIAHDRAHDLDLPGQCHALGQPFHRADDRNRDRSREGSGRHIRTRRQRDADKKRGGDNTKRRTTGPHGCLTDAGHRIFRFGVRRWALCASMYFRTAAMSPSPSRRLGITTCLYFANSASAIGSFCASNWSGVLMKRSSHARSRACVTPTRSGPMLSPSPNVWHAAHLVLNRYAPGSSPAIGRAAS